MSGTIDRSCHLVNFDLDGGGLCELTNNRYNRAMTTMDYNKSTCDECRRIYREKARAQESDPDKKDILRIMFEQNCSMETATYVHEARTEMERKIKELRRVKNASRS